ncbi:MAG: acetyl-CoA carboxylase, carboxyltransferase subunit beta [Clostridiaceae bacterium]
MNLKEIFRKPLNTLEGTGLIKTREERSKAKEEKKSEKAGRVQCPKCQIMIPEDKLMENYQVCTYCGHHMKMKVKDRINLIADEDSFEEMDDSLTSVNFLNFPGYTEKLEKDKKKSGSEEAVTTGTCRVSGYKTALFVMDPFFMMGSMGSVVGEKITRLFEYATRERLPVTGICVSGGARMQEGITSLMQMAKTSGAVRYHSDAGLLYTAVLTDPTTGGVTASFAMEADIIIAEPKALIAFAGPRVIEDTIKKKLPPDFQRAEFLLDKGFIDSIVPRRHLKGYLRRLLALHGGED